MPVRVKLAAAMNMRPGSRIGRLPGEVFQA
jgi:hypothetical protein